MEEYGKKKFKRHDGKEESLQEACMTWVRMQHPDLFSVHIANEGKHKPQYRAKLKRLGLVSGMPDIMIFNGNYGYVGLSIELKSGYNTPKHTQLEVAERLERGGWYCTWVRSLDAFIEIVTRYVRDEV